MTTATDTHIYTLHFSGTLGEDFLTDYCPVGTTLTVGEHAFTLSTLRADQAGVLGIIRSLHNFGCTLLQSLLLVLVATWWINHPQNKWLGWLMGVIFVVILLLGTAGVLAGLGIMQAPV